MTSSLCEIEKLVELFNLSVSGDQRDDELAEDDIQDGTSTQCSSNENKINRGNAPKKKPGPYTKVEPPKRKEILDSESENIDEYFEETSTNAGLQDWKKIPKWDISYRQSVTASDVFLGMGFKNPSTASCENMIITIDLPGENRQNIDLKIEKQSLTLTSPKFLLELNLPHAVDPKRGEAQFDQEGEKLIVTLIMDRELDILNF